MRISDVIQKDRDAMKALPFSEKLAHLWEYYKWYIASFLLLVIFIISMVSSNIAANNRILNGVFLNASPDPGIVTQMEQDFQKTIQETENGQSVYFDTSMHYTTDPSAAEATSIYETLQLLMAKVHACEIDFLVTDNDALYPLIYNEFFVDLSSVLTEEQYNRYQPHFLYMDLAFLENIRNTDPSASPDAQITYPDPTKPELMEKPIPILVNIYGCEWISEFYPLSKDLCAFGIVTNYQHIDTALAFLDYLLLIE